ncbi:hypothetical protein QVD17_05138 [Tagetes erecta]|uniref:Uncharacterized protein n=1 Tax=Tagetes erecta TaxID=13708 RepID=A0AAD8PB89_TARER|nr:hypothetical protein QVD17_05138 [Tagetes erecta]
MSSPASSPEVNTATLIVDVPLLETTATKHPTSPENQRLGRRNFLMKFGLRLRRGWRQDGGVFVTPDSSRWCQIVAGDKEIDSGVQKGFWV